MTIGTGPILLRSHHLILILILRATFPANISGQRSPKHILRLRQRRITQRPPILRVGEPMLEQVEPPRQQNLMESILGSTGLFQSDPRYVGFANVVDVRGVEAFVLEEDVDPILLAVVEGVVGFPVVTVVVVFLLLCLVPTTITTLRDTPQNRRRNSRRTTTTTLWNNQRILHKSSRLDPQNPIIPKIKPRPGHHPHHLSSQIEDPPPLFFRLTGHTFPLLKG
mmetsp:Transcript_25658/g.56177  ORF Transcript_25658/g.56177 Transcript_25658/m.56177 type:complete len:223 (-) Transcript_25658:482-1150(-)